jgi:primosomal protein N' (replication factor Y) (superfamily II helicase)
MLQARIVIVGAAGGLEPLTYRVPPAMEACLACGHRVLVPLRSRRLTGVVVEIGRDLIGDLGGGAGQLRPIMEVLETRPLFDRAHLELLKFLSSYYMAPLAEAYRSVVPGAARVESRRMFKMAMAPSPLARAAFTALEGAIVEALGKRPMTARQLERLGDRNAVKAAIGRLMADGFVERHDGTRGHHREPSETAVVRLKDESAPGRLRGPRQRAIIDAIRAHGAAGMRLTDLEADTPKAAALVRAMARRNIIELSQTAASSRNGDVLEPAERNGLIAGANGFEGADGIDLNAEQIAAIEAAAPAVRDARFETLLLWGVTASGKTEVYLKLAAHALAAGRTVLVLVPEIAMADQLVRSFRGRFGSMAAVLHSGQNISERWSSWMAALNGRARILIGPRSTVFAPLPDPGLIVVDEEHDGAYKQEEGIRYHARDVAVALGQFSRCPVVLGSATPSAESFVNARRGRYRLLRLSRRVMERPMAEVTVIDLREEARKEREASGPGAGNSEKPAGLPPLSTALVDALRENLAAGGQSMVFLNRRGYHNFLQCRLCGVVIACPNCSVSMTFHLRDHSLRCHYCGHRVGAPEKCAECGGFGLEGQGFGTERLAAALGEMIPGARIERMDSDTSGRRGARIRLLDALGRGEIDVLVGTQMIAKGFDFPGVTLVAVVLADLGLNLPDFRSAERTFQLLTQVAGRAGRGDRPGRVLVQTYAPHHYAIRAAREQDYGRFIRRELGLRRELMYPPYARMTLVRVEGADARRVGALAAKAASALGRFAKPDALRVLGPAPAPLERIKRRYRWQVVVKSTGLKEMREALSTMRAELAPLAEGEDIYLAIDIDPVNML